MASPDRRAIVKRSVATPLAILVVCGCVFLTACRGVNTSTYTFTLDESYKVNEPVKRERCYDAAVLLGTNLADSKVIANKVWAAIDAAPTSETETEIKAQRNRHLGVLVGTGGEVFLVTFKSASSDTTFVTAATKTGVVGGAGQRGWSCRIVDQMVAIATK